jgi:hypothetical protein
MATNDRQRSDAASKQTALATTDRRTRAPRRARHQASLGTVALFVAAAIGVISFYHPDRPLLPRPFVSIAEAAAPAASPSANAFGKSGEVRVRFSLPDQAVEYPIDVQGDPRSLAYQWVRVGDTAATAALRPLAGNVVAPSSPGFYRLALARTVRDSASGRPLVTERRVVDGMTLAVLVPFSQKLGATLNGYRIGTYLAERLKGGSHDHPEGFVQVGAEDVDLALSKHLRLGDFVTHDAQDTWPRYAALNPQLLDKLELVLAEIASWRGDTANVHVDVDVHSGFRTPLYNRTVKRSAKDSRHQYGDAADVTIDANGDGRYTAADTKLVVKAVEAVEARHPDLTGGLGLYTSRRYSTPYVHIDARGTRARWHG